MQRILTLLLLTAFTSELMAQSPPVLKIAVMRSGEIIADGKPTTVEGVISLLRDLAAKKGVVWYCREAPEPHPTALKVLNAIVGQRLPVRLSSKPDFSDSI